MKIECIEHSFDKGQSKFITSSMSEIPLYPSYGINAQKIFKIINMYHLAIGSQEKV